MDLRAQVAGGTLSGTVTNQSGEPLPGAEICITELATDAIRKVKAGTGGAYAFLNFLPGHYEISVSTPGFVTQVRTGIAVDVGDNIVLNVVMRPGAIQSVHESHAAASVAQATSAAKGNVNTATVENSPLNGRDWTQLATLQPGVSGIQTANSTQGHVAQRGFGAAMSISGGRPEQNSYRLDGISINDYSNGAPGSVLGANLGVDAVEQFAVLRSNYPAEYGRTSGGVINAVTRAGTNAFRGSVYEFLRNSALDARNFFDAGIPPFHRNQFGASAGGPVRKGRTFFFADYEGLRQSLGVTRVDTVPSATAHAGQLSTGSVPVDQVVKRYLDAFFPLPNGPLLGNGDTGIFSFPAQQVTTENYLTTRDDHKFSEKDSLFGTYMRDYSKIVQPDAYDQLLSDVVSRRQILVLQEQHIFRANFLNVVRFGFNRAVAVDGGLTRVIDPQVADPSFGMIPGQFVGGIQVPGLTAFGGGPSAEFGTLGSSKKFAWNSFQAYDDAFLTRAAHSLQFGFVVERMQDNEGVVSNSNGAFIFSSLPAFLKNQPQTFEGLSPGPIGVFGTRQTLAGGYIQDDIRSRKNLALNLGLRYEMATVPTEAHNRISNLRNLKDSQYRLGSPYFLNPTLGNFEPRVGFAWDPLGDAKSAVRSGFGIFDVLPLAYQFSIVTPLAAPYSRVLFGTTLPAGSFPTGAYQHLAASASAFRASYVEHTPKRNYVMEWNLNLEREIFPNFVITLGYVGSHSVHLPFRMDDFDTVLPLKTAAGYLYPPRASSQRLNPNFGRISGILWESTASYHALQTVVQWRTSRGLQLRGAYTWAKGIDTSSVTIAGDQLENSIVNPSFFDPRPNRGLSDFNIAQNFVYNFSWEVPAPRSTSAFAKWVAGGWQLGSIFKASTGVPFTALLAGDPLGTKLTEVSEVPNLLAGPGCRTLTNPGNPNSYIKTQCFLFPTPASLRGNLGRNTLTGPGFSNFDFSLLKNNRIRKISETFNVQFRAEFFNILNRANFAPPLSNLAVFDRSGNPIPGAGLITSTQAPAREIQLALKLIW